MASSSRARAASNGAPAALEAIDRVLEQRASAIVIAAGAREHPLGQIGGCRQRRRADVPLHLAERLDRRARLLELALRGPGVDEQLERRRTIEAAVRGQLPQQPLEQLRRLQRLPAVERQAGTAEVGLRRGARLVEQPLGVRRPALPPPQLGEPHTRAAGPCRA